MWHHKSTNLMEYNIKFDKIFILYSLMKKKKFTDIQEKKSKQTGTEFFLKVF